MKVAKILLIVFAIIMAFPIGFAIIYSAQAGCFLCLEGEMAGSWQEKIANIVLLLVVIAGIAAGVYAFRRRS